MAVFCDYAGFSDLLRLMFCIDYDLALIASLTILQNAKYIIM